MGVGCSSILEIILFPLSRKFQTFKTFSSISTIHIQSPGFWYLSNYKIFSFHSLFDPAALQCKNRAILN